MKRYISFALAMSVAAVAGCGVALAEDGYSAPTAVPANRAERVEARTTKIEEKKAEVAEKRAERKSKIEAKRVENVKKLNQKAVERFTNAIARQGNIGARLESFIAKAKSEGKDVAALETSLAEARTLYDVASTKVAGLEAALEAALALETPKEARTEIQAKIKEAKKAIDDAHVKMAQTLKLAKALRPAAGTATTTTPAAAPVQ